MGFEEPIKEKVVEKVKPKDRWVVVNELPTQVIRKTLSEDGKEMLHFITAMEALSQIMNEESK